MNKLKQYQTRFKCCLSVLEPVNRFGMSAASFPKLLGDVCFRQPHHSPQPASPCLPLPSPASPCLPLPPPASPSLPLPPPARMMQSSALSPRAGNFRLLHRALSEGWWRLHTTTLCRWCRGTVKHSLGRLTEASDHVFVQIYVCWCICVFLYWQNSVRKYLWHFCIANLLLILMAKLGAWHLICIPAEIVVGMPHSKQWKWH